MADLEGKEKQLLETATGWDAAARRATHLHKLHLTQQDGYLVKDKYHVRDPPLLPNNIKKYS